MPSRAATLSFMACSELRTLIVEDEKEAGKVIPMAAMPDVGIASFRGIFGGWAGLIPFLLHFLTGANIAGRKESMWPLILADYIIYIQAFWTDATNGNGLNKSITFNSKLPYVLTCC